MTKTLTITLPDALEQALAQTAAQANQSTEELILKLLTQNLIPETEEQTDPLMALFGSISSDVPDAADRHDYYIGKAIYDEMHSDE